MLSMPMFWTPRKQMQDSRDGQAKYDNPTANFFHHKHCPQDAINQVQARYTNTT